MKGKIMIKRILVVFLAGTCLLATSCGMGKEEEQVIELVAEDDGEGYVTVTAEYGDVVEKKAVRCNYMSMEQEDIYFDPASTWIEQINVKKGDIVKKGDLLFSAQVDYLEEEIEELEYQIDSLSLQLAHTKEMEAFDLSSTEFMFNYTGMTKSDEERMAEELAEIERSYAEEIRELEDAIHIAQKRLEKCKKEWQDGRVVAGIDGMITYMDKMAIYNFGADDEVKILTISNLDSCYFVAEDMDDEVFFKDVSSATFTYLDGGWSYCEVEPVLTEQWDTGMYFKPVNGELFDIGQVGEITVETDRKENVLCIPNAALHESEEGDFVYVSEDGLLSMRYVTVGLRGFETTEITDGLALGEEIVLKK